MSGKHKHLYKIIFYDEGKLYEIYAEGVYQGDLYGFVIVEGLLFGEESTVVVDPSEERMKAEFAGVKRTYLPMHAIVRIDEVEKGGTAKITPLPDNGGNITPFPMPIYTPGNDSGKS